MTSITITNNDLKTLSAGEEDFCLLCLNIEGSAMYLNAAQAAALVQYIALLLEAKEKDEEGNYQLLKDNQ